MTNLTKNVQRDNGIIVFARRMFAVDICKRLISWLENEVVNFAFVSSIDDGPVFVSIFEGNVDSVEWCQQQRNDESFEIS